MDKAVESLFGYVTVLPGAFCGFRWRDIMNEPIKEHYFYAFKPGAEMTCVKANMFLAEDRVLCAGIVLRP